MAMTVDELKAKLDVLPGDLKVLMQITAENGRTSGGPLRIVALIPPLELPPETFSPESFVLLESR